MNPVLGTIAPSLIRVINAKKRAGDIDLGMGEPTLLPDPAPFEAALRRVRDEGLPYTPNAGDPALRAAIAAYFAFPRMAAAENVCVAIGSEEALYLAIKAVLDPARDELLVVEPAYLAYEKIAALEGVRTRAVRLSADDDFRPRAAAVLDSLRPAASGPRPSCARWPRGSPRVPSPCTCCVTRSIASCTTATRGRRRWRRCIRTRWWRGRSRRATR